MFLRTHVCVWVLVFAAVILMAGTSSAEESDAVKIHSAPKPVNLWPSKTVIITPKPVQQMKPGGTSSGTPIKPINISVPKPTGGPVGQPTQRPPQKPVPVEQTISISKPGGGNAPRPPIEKPGSKQKPQTVTGQGTGKSQTGTSVLTPIAKPTPPVQSPIAKQNPGQKAPAQQAGVPQPSGGGAQNPPAGGVRPPGNQSGWLGNPVGKNITGNPVGTNITGNPVGTNITGNPVGTNITGNPVGTNITGNPVGTNITGNPVGKNIFGNPGN